MRDGDKKKNCIYTVIIDNYDYMPIISNTKSDDIDYYCITDNKNLQSDVWKMIYVENNHNVEGDIAIKIHNIKLSRYYKTNYFLFFRDYENIVYIDARMRVNGDILNYFNELGNYDMVLMKHPNCPNILKEMDRVVMRRLETQEMVNNVKTRYEENEYDYNNGLNAGGVILFKNNLKVRDFFSDWWNEIMQFSHRDQLSLNYALHKNSGLEVKVLRFRDVIGKYFLQTGRKTDRIKVY